MIENRPEFKSIKSFEEFEKYYWYRKELAEICKSLDLEYRGTKKELNQIIKAYFEGNLIRKTSKQVPKKCVEEISLDSPLLTCGFSFNTTFRGYFSDLTGVSPFKFTVDMATAWRKVKKEQDFNVTIADMLSIYRGDSDYAKYDHSTSLWNLFLKDFHADDISQEYTNKLKVAAIL